MKDIIKLEQRIEDRWPGLEDRLTKVIAVAAGLEIIALIVWWILNHYRT